MYMTKAITEIQGSASSRKHRMHFQKQSFVLFVGCAKCLSSDSILESFRSIQSIFLFFKKFADKVFAKEVNYVSFITCMPQLKRLLIQFSQFMPLKFFD